MREKCTMSAASQKPLECLGEVFGFVTDCYKEFGDSTDDHNLAYGSCRYSPFIIGTPLTR